MLFVQRGDLNLSTKTWLLCMEKNEIMAQINVKYYALTYKISSTYVYFSIQIFNVHKEFF